MSFTVIAVVLALGVCPHLRGIEMGAPPPASIPAPAPADDQLAAAFDQLFALGLPDVRGRRWVEVRYRRLLSDAQLRPPPWPPRGSFLGATPEGGRFPSVVVGAQRYVLVEQEAWERHRAAQGDMHALLLSCPDWPLVAEDGPVAVDLLDTAARLTAWLAPWPATRRSPAAGKSQSQWDRDEYHGDWTKTEVLIFAAQLHQLGHPAEARTLARTLFAGEEAAKLFASARLKVARARYDAAIFALSRTGDWRAAADTLDRLLADFPHGWPERPLVVRMRDEARRHASGEAPPALAGPAWSDDDRAWAAALLRGRWGAPTNQTWMFAARRGRSRAGRQSRRTAVRRADGRRPAPRTRGWRAAVARGPV